MLVTAKSAERSIETKHYQENKEYYKSKARAYKARRHKEFDALRKTLKCAICGEDRFYCLDFHHIDPSEKRN